MYVKFINNNLFNKYLYDKHHSLINLNYNKYNINANFSNYKNVGEHSSKQHENQYDIHEQNDDDNNKLCIPKIIIIIYILLKNIKINQSPQGT
ncbi:hypothetical protein PFTANZ_01454 [Plasmodium falciparum Tanzania (2000708)]|uniref:Uncharacterized protein n=1 Tax=Plasmodium falciparum Tanzania (2000708) TaxID=1036725 RepID=A0A024WA81_PLAFA|nr:hypothetical protein PFTANZ_01454 [Plasmodium falciparum Tanzania (2000708)]